MNIANQIENHTFLITGGAGFIGSHIVEYLIERNVKLVRVIDNLSNGHFDNIAKYEALKNFEFIEGDICDLTTVEKCMKGINFLSHQAALGSVPRSIKDPINSNKANVSGFLNVIETARKSKDLKKMVYAASSSTYGDSSILPKKEGFEGKPLSPYAVTKVINELYADVYSTTYNFNSIGLRYFNVFGPNQRSGNPYAAVIPIFCSRIINNESPIINGDGLTSRDFTYIDNVIQANIKSLFTPNINKHEVFNIGCGSQISLNMLVETINQYLGKDIQPQYGPQRKGDVMHSLADISKASKYLGYKPDVDFKTGISKLLDSLIIRVNEN